MKKYFLNIVLLVNIIKIIYSAYEIPGKINHTHENFSYSMQKDMANCTCDLSSLCDYNCPCDPKCTEEEDPTNQDISCSYHYSGYKFTDGVMIAGNEQMTDPDGSTVTGHSGNGYARITLID